MNLLLRIFLANQVLAALLTCAFALVVGLRHLGEVALTTFLFTNAVGGCVGSMFALMDRSGIYHGSPAPVRNLLRAGVVVVGTALGLALALALLRLLRPNSAMGWGALRELALFALLVTVTMTGLNIAFQRLKRRIEEKAVEVQKLRELEAQTRLLNLQGKVNPHFLFNTLNSMLNLVHTAPETLETLIVRLSELYRRVLQLPESGTVPLADELELVRLYLEIEQVRLGERLRFSIVAEPGTATFPIPPLLVQPLVENAVKHGIGPRPEGGEIRVTARVDGKVLTISVEDDGAGVGGSAKGSGFGLYGVRERLRLLHGDHARLLAAPREEGGFRAELQVPV